MNIGADRALAVVCFSICTSPYKELLFHVLVFLLTTLNTPL